MKRILLLGGSAQQVIAIETAKKLGYYTIVCDYLEDNPGQYVADAFYLESTTNKEKILEIAQKEKVDGILAYASDPAAPTAAYVATELGLETNPYDSVITLCNKDIFRRFLEDNGFNVPKAKGYCLGDDIYKDIEKFDYPIIIKPVDSSGSKGITVVRDFEKIQSAIEYAFSYSRSGRIIVEEYIEKKHPYLIGGDIFISEGKVIVWGLMNCHRDSNVNSLVPVGKSYPLELDIEDERKVKSVLQKLVDFLKIKNGAMNIEVIIDKNDKVFLLDVGPRNGGNMIPDLLGYIFGINIVEMTILAAMGKKIECNSYQADSYYATQNLHTKKSGIYNKIVFSKELESYIIRKCIYKKCGDKVEYFDNAAKALGIIFMKFNNKEEMQNILSDINSHITIDVIEKND